MSPFVSRLGAERHVVQTVNSRSARGVNLAGLSDEAIARWSSQLPEQFSAAHRESLAASLRAISSRLKLSASSSHRGAVDGPSPDLSLVVDELNDVVRLLGGAVCDESGHESRRV